MMTWWFYVRQCPELENCPRAMISRHTFAIQISILHVIWDVGELIAIDIRIKESNYLGNSLVMILIIPSKIYIYNL